MTINQSVLSALTPIVANTWAVELPENPTFPALVFEVETNPEQTWVMGGGYDQHTVTVYILTKTVQERIAIESQIKTALGNVSGYLFEGDSGDADYEDDASIYAYFSTHVIREPKY